MRISLGAGASTSAWRMKNSMSPISATAPAAMGAQAGIVVRREKLERRFLRLNMCL